jgi:hypothetical protein
MSHRRAPQPGVVAGGGLGGVFVVGGGGSLVGIVVGSVLVLVSLDVLVRAGPFRRTRSSGRSGGMERPRVCRGGTARGLLRAWTSVDRLVNYLLDRAVDTLPAAARDRYTEEWHDHRQHYCGWRLVWWALWVRATALRTGTALEPARLPREE